VGGGEIERGGWGKSRMFPVCFFPRCLREVGGIWMDTPSEGGEEGWVRGGEREEITMVTQHEEAAGAEVAVELDEDLVGGGGHALLGRVSAELANLWRGLVRTVPVINHKQKRHVEEILECFWR
jgi:hypothetical protein